MPHNILEQEVAVTRYVTAEHFIRYMAEFDFGSKYEYDDNDDGMIYPLELFEDYELSQNADAIMYMMCTVEEYKKYNGSDRSLIMQFVFDNIERIEIL